MPGDPKHSGSGDFLKTYSEWKPRQECHIVGRTLHSRRITSSGGSTASESGAEAMGAEESQDQERPGVLARTTPGSCR